MGKYLANELSQEPVIYLSSVGADAVRTGYAHGTHVVRTWGWDRPGDRDRQEKLKKNIGKAKAQVKHEKSTRKPKPLPKPSENHRNCV